METWVDSETVYEGKLVTLRRGSVRLDGGQEATREVVEHNGGVTIAPWTGEAVVLIRQYRIATAKEMLELPAGKLEAADEDPLERGRLELEEETGYVAGRMIAAGHFFPSCGFLTEKLHLFLALDLEKTEQRLEWDEVIEVVEMPVAEVQRRLNAHEFDDAKTIIGLHALLNHPEVAGGE